MSTDYLSELKYLGLISRIKRLSDATIADGRKLYQHIAIGIQPNWFLVFRILQERGESTVSEVAGLLNFAHTSVIAIVRKMEAAGYLEIAVSAADKRKQTIKLSSKAKQQLPEMQVVWTACEEAVKSLFTDDNFLLELEKMEQALAAESFHDRVLNGLPPQGVKICAFKPADSRDFERLNQRWLKQYFSIEPHDKLVLSNPEIYILNVGGHIFMARLQERNVGTFALLPKSKKEVELCRMAVSPRYQGKGIGNKLLSRAIACANAENYKSIVLYSNTVLEPALNLYRKYGFEAVKLEKGAIYERANIKMKLKL